MNKQGNSTRCRTKTVFLAVRLTEGEKLLLLALSRRVGQPGNLSAAARYAIEQAAQRQPVPMEATA